MKDKKALILALVVLNAALLGVLVVAHAERSAQAQAIPGAVGRFVVGTQLVDSDRSLLWVVDSVSRRAVVYRLDRRNNTLEEVEKFPLQRVFRYRGEGETETPPRGTK